MKTCNLSCLACLLFVASVSQSHAAELIPREPGPCRIADTRTGSPIAAGTTRNFFLAFGAAISQGGTDPNCGVPTGAVAVELNVKGAPLFVDGGHFRVFRTGVGQGVYSSLQLDDVLQFTGISIDVPLGPTQEVSIFSILDANAIIDIEGWYMPVGVAGKLSNVAGPPDTITLETESGLVTVYPGGSDLDFLAQWQNETQSLSHEQWISLAVGRWRNANTFESLSLP